MRLVRILPLVLLALCAMLVACSSEHDEPETPARRMVLVYMVASNSLGSLERDLQDLDEMDHAVQREGLNDCRWLVYRVGPDGEAPTLFEIKKGKRNTAVHETLKVYDSASGASVTAQRMSEVIADAKSLAPALDYGLVLWSHSTGWAPSLTTRSQMPRRVFGEDNGATMPIDELARAIPVGLFSWIYADACYMGGIEVAYELRDRCHYFVGYPTEIPGRGMPYELTLPLLCADNAGLVDACRATYEYYDIQTGINRTFSGAVVDCSRFDEMAAVCRRIHASGNPEPDLSSIQCYNLNSYHFFYDFMQYTLACANDDDAVALKDLYDQAVLYKAATPTIFSRILIDSDNFSGLSTYVLGTSPGVNESYYHALGWYQSVYGQP